jgi:hypothetical protein
VKSKVTVKVFGGIALLSFIFNCYTMIRFANGNKPYVNNVDFLLLAVTAVTAITWIILHFQQSTDGSVLTKEVLKHD